MSWCPIPPNVEASPVRRRRLRTARRGKLSDMRLGATRNRGHRRPLSALGCERRCSTIPCRRRRVLLRLERRDRVAGPFLAVTDPRRACPNAPHLFDLMGSALVGANGDGLKGANRSSWRSMPSTMEERLLFAATLRPVGTPLTARLAPPSGSRSTATDDRAPSIPASRARSSEPPQLALSKSARGARPRGQDRQDEGRARPIWPTTPASTRLGSGTPPWSGPGTRVPSGDVGGLGRAGEDAGGVLENLERWTGGIRRPKTSARCVASGGNSGSLTVPRP